MKASLQLQPMYCSRDYNYSSRFNLSFCMLQLYWYDLLHPLTLYLVMYPTSFFLLFLLFVAFVLFVPLVYLYPLFLILHYKMSWFSTVMTPSLFTFVPGGQSTSILRPTVSSICTKSSSIFYPNIYLCHKTCLYPLSFFHHLYYVYLYSYYLLKLFLLEILIVPSLIYISIIWPAFVIEAFSILIIIILISYSECQRLASALTIFWFEWLWLPVLSRELF